MCLSYDENATNEVRNRLDAEGSIAVFKLFSVTPTCNVITPYQGTPVDVSPEGYFVSHRVGAARTGSEIVAGLVADGIHVYLTREAAEESEDEGDFVLEVSGSAADFVAANRVHAVFTRIGVDAAALATAAAACHAKVEWSTDDDDGWDDDDDDDWDDDWDDDEDEDDEDEWDDD